MSLPSFLLPPFLRTAFDYKQYRLAQRVDFGADERLKINFQMHDAKLNVKLGGSSRNSENYRSSSQFNPLSNPLSLFAPTLNPSLTEKPLMLTWSRSETSRPHVHWIPCY